MFRHIVLMSFVPESTPEERAAVLEGLSRLPSAIPEIRRYVFGPDAGLAEGNYDLAVVADFDDADAYGRYADHPDHEQLRAEKIRPILASRAAVQHTLSTDQ